jgi:hypothetical protein
MMAALARSRHLMRRRRLDASNVEYAYWSQKKLKINNTPVMSR